ncbi:MAG: hypothetical protein HUK21_07875 [Fibrobacteraceae bacterium]|nr:hypothetical protein [Fibrobacteraceae bacterium]
MNSIIRKSVPLLLAFSGIYTACSLKWEKDSYIEYYESKCVSEISQGGFIFKAMELNPDYEIAKWGSQLDSSYRIVLWVYPRSEGVIRDAFLISKKDTIRPIAARKTPLFETGNTDSFSFVFEDKPEKGEIHIKNYNNRLGNVAIATKNCQNIRLK